MNSVHLCKSTARGANHTEWTQIASVYDIPQNYTLVVRVSYPCLHLQQGSIAGTTWRQLERQRTLLQQQQRRLRKAGDAHTTLETASHRVGLSQNSTEQQLSL